LRSVDVFLHNIGDIAIELTFGKASAKKELTNIATDCQQQNRQSNGSAPDKAKDQKEFKFTHLHK